MKISDKRHWYDGWIYDRILAPNQKVPFDKISALISPGSRVIDIGCGTGRLDFRIAEKCSSIIAIDLSEKNIATAIDTQKRLGINNIKFIHTDLASFMDGGKVFFDYAVLSYILHEVNTGERIRILNDTASVAGRIIVSDHKPETTAIPATIREIMEFGAGKDHYLNYRSFIREGGIKSLSERCGLRITDEQVHSSHLHIAVLQK